MAEIRPLRAWRYNNDLTKNIEALTSPLFDVVSDKQRKALYQNPYNSIHLSVPATDQPATRAAEILATWKKEGIVRQDALPGIYVYYQYFSLAGIAKEFCRKGFICNIRVYDWPERVILRHENTIPKSVNDRVELLEKTELNVSPTFGLYTDEEFILEPYMDKAIENPCYETEDYQGARDVMAMIDDPYIIEKFIAVLQNKQVILADGHHRYEGSLIYKKKQEQVTVNPTGQEGYNFHMMYLANTEAGDFRILPTHRLLKNIPDFNETAFIKCLENDFIIKPVEDPGTLNEIILGKKWAFGVILKDQAFKIRLKNESFHTLAWPFPLVVKELDLTVLHFFIIEKIIGIAGKEQRQSDKLDFERSFSECLSKVIKQEAQVAIITNEISIEEVKNICHSGFTMPQKSTYFYPKVICGFLFGSINEDEFNTYISDGSDAGI